MLHLFAPLLLNIRCRYSVFTSLAVPEFLSRSFTVDWNSFKDLIQRLGSCDRHGYRHLRLFLGGGLFVHVPAAAMHKPLLGVFLEKSLHWCIIVDVRVCAFITDVSFQCVCFLYSS